MKKIAVFAVAAAMLLTACGKSEGTPDSGAQVTTEASDEAVKDETTAPPETTAEETTATEPAVKENPSTDFEFEENDGEITITKFKGSGDEVIIPAEINGMPVTVISYDAFNGSGIKSVVIPEGVASISSTSFRDCRNLTDITFPESLAEVTIGWDGYPKPCVPFDNTPWLEAKRAENPLVIVNNVLIDGRTCSRKVEIPEGVTQIAAGAFYEGTTVTSVSIPSSVEKIDQSAFYGCERLTDIVLPDSVSYIGDFAFNNCIALENVTFPNNTVEMGIEIFGGSGNFVPWLKNKTAEDPLVIINGNLINGNKCTGSVVIPDSVKSIAAGAFDAYSNTAICQATSVTLPDGITKIPDSLFRNCIYLTNVNIPDSVTEIGWSAFAYCNSLKSITIPNKVTLINGFAFQHAGLDSITIPESVTEIGDKVFYDCQIKNITFSNGLKKIGSWAFEGSRNLKELTLPDSLESISTDAFKNCEFDVTYNGEIYFPELYNELYASINGD